MESDYQEQDRIQELAQRIKQLLKRENLCHNTYLYKRMHNKLTVPLSLIVEESSISKITNNQQEVIQALQQTNLVQIVASKEVKIIEFPTVKISLSSHQGLRELERILEEKDKKYEISKRFDTDQYINLTLFSDDLLWLEELIKSIAKQIEFQRADLMKDIQFGVDRIRRLKIQHAKQKTALGKTKYSLNSPPQIFIRKAIDSSPESQSEDEDNAKGAAQHKTNGFQAKKGSNGYKRNKKVPKPRLEESDFPTLS